MSQTLVWSSGAMRSNLNQTDVFIFSCLSVSGNRGLFTPLECYQETRYVGSNVGSWKIENEVVL